MSAIEGEGDLVVVVVVVVGSKCLGGAIDCRKDKRRQTGSPVVCLVLGAWCWCLRGRRQPPTIPPAAGVSQSL